MAEVKALKAGYREFYQKYFESDDTLYRELSTGQSPKTLIIACSDSRVDPSIVTHAEPGDIFVIRNVANLVPPYQVDEPGLHGVSAALEFAVGVIKVKHIVVMGHSGCAGITALLHPENLTETDFIGNWVEVAAEAREKTRATASDDDAQHVCEHQGVLLSLRNLLTFPWIKSRVEAGELKLHGWHFTLENGQMQEYDPESDDFRSIPTS